MSTQTTNDGGVITGPSAGTIVWGLIAVAVSLLVLLGVVFGISFDFGQVLIALLIGSGLALVAGGIWGVLRTRDKAADPYRSSDRDTP
jgi:ABC-type nickel/cobalt efflux system permease component RcnA